MTDTDELRKLAEAAAYEISGTCLDGCHGIDHDGMARIIAELLADRLQAVEAERDEMEELARDMTGRWKRQVNEIGLVLLSRAEAAEAKLVEARQVVKWYAELPNGWTINAGAGMTYGSLHLLGEKARTFLKEASHDG